MSIYTDLDLALRSTCLPVTPPSLRYRLDPDTHMRCAAAYTASASAEQLLVVDRVSLGEPYRRPAERTRDIVHAIYRTHANTVDMFTDISTTLSKKTLSAIDDLVPGYLRMDGYDSADDYLSRPATETLVDRTSLYRAIASIPYMVQRAYKAFEIEPDVFTSDRIATVIAPVTDEHRAHFTVSWSDKAHRVDVTSSYQHDTYGGTVLGPHGKDYPLGHAGYTADTLHILQKATERAHLELRTLVRQAPHRITAAVTAYTDHLAELSEMGLLEKATQGLPVIADWPTVSVGRHMISYYVGVVESALEYCRMATTVLNGCSSHCD